jgi:hypothetical protein
MLANEIDVNARIGFSGEFWFYVNNLQPDFEASTIGAVRKRLGRAGQALTVRIKPRL